MLYRPKSSQIQAYRAQAILPMNFLDSYIRDGLLIIQDDTIKEVGRYKELIKSYIGPVQDLGEAVIVPGLVNAHTHLELSHLQGKTALEQGFENWMKSLVQLSMDQVDPEILESVFSSLRENGISCVGDISGRNPHTVLETLKESEIELYYRLFIEFLGFKRPNSDHIAWPKHVSPSKNPELSVAGHALYSTHPTTLQLLKNWGTQNHRPFSIHLAEHSGEVELLTTGRGQFADLLRKILLPENYIPPNTTPVKYADQLGLLDQRTLAVHCVHINSTDVQILKDRDVCVCLCPRSNYYISGDTPPWEEMWQAGISLCLGTDSLSSNLDLNLWNEALHLLENSTQKISLIELMKLLTINPAQALGVQNILGSLELGKRGCFTTVPQVLRENISLVE